MYYTRRRERGRPLGGVHERRGAAADPAERRRDLLVTLPGGLVAQGRDIGSSAAPCGNADGLRPGHAGPSGRGWRRWWLLPHGAALLFLSAGGRRSGHGRRAARQRGVNRIGRKPSGFRGGGWPNG